MPSITTSAPSVINCFRLSGSGIPQSERVQTFGITGVDGVGVQLLGSFGEPSTWTAKQFGSVAGLSSWFNSLVAAKGAVATFVNDEGQSYTNQLIESVGQLQKQTANDLNGSMAIWTVQIQARTV